MIAKTIRMAVKLTLNPYVLDSLISILELPLSDILLDEICFET
jgi:hypothetical protein